MRYAILLAMIFFASCSIVKEDDVALVKLDLMSKHLAEMEIHINCMNNLIKIEGHYIREGACNHFKKGGMCRLTQDEILEYIGTILYDCQKAQENK